MDAQLQDVLGQLRDLNPDTIRLRLLEIEAEEKALRVILRTAKAAQSAADSIGRSIAEGHEKVFQSLRQSAKAAQTAIEEIERR